MRRRLLDLVAPGQGAVRGVDRQRRTKPGEHRAKLPAGRGKQRGEPQGGPAGGKAMNEKAGDTRGHGVFARPKTTPPLDVRRPAL